MNNTLFEKADAYSLLLEISVNLTEVWDTYIKLHVLSINETICDVPSLQLVSAQ